MLGGAGPNDAYIRLKPKMTPSKTLSISLLGSLALLAHAPVRAGDLVDAYHLAQDQDQTFQAALHQRNAALQARPQALSAWLPQVTAHAGLEHDREHILSLQSATQLADSNGDIPPSESKDYFGSRTYTVSLSQKLFDWSAYKTVAQANQQVAQAEASFRSAQQSLVLRTVQAYLTVLSAADVLRVDQEAQETYAQQLDQAKEKYKAGFSPVTDVFNAQASYDSNSATVIIDQTALEDAKQALGVLIGKPVTSFATLQDEIPLVAPNPVGVEAWSQSGGTDNTDLMSALFAREAARMQVAALRGKYLPTLSAVGSVGHQTSHAPSGDDVVQDAVGLSLDWNVFQGGLVHSQVRQALEQYEQSQAVYELQRRSVEQNVRDDFRGVVNGIATIKASKLAVTSNQASVDASNVGLKVGTRNQSDVLVARQSLQLAERSFYLSRYAYLISMLKLKQDVGRLSESDLAQIDSLLGQASASGPADAPAAAAASPAGPVGTDMVTAPAESPSAGSDLLTDGDFENGLLGWQINERFFVFSTGKPHGGRQYAACGVNSDGNRVATSGSISQSITVPTNAKNVTVTGWMQVSSAIAAKKSDEASITVRQGTKEFRLMQMSNLDADGKTSRYRQGAVTFPATSGGNLVVSVECKSVSGLSVFRIDDISVTWQ